MKRAESFNNYAIFAPWGWATAASRCISRFARFSATVSSFPTSKTNGISLDKKSDSLETASICWSAREPEQKLEMALGELIGRGSRPTNDGKNATINKSSACVSGVIRGAGGGKKKLESISFALSRTGESAREG